MSQENVEIVRQSLDAYNTGDIDAAIRSGHPDIEIHPTLVGGLEGTVYRGIDGYRHFLTDIDATFEQFRVQPDEFRDLGDTVLVFGRASGRGRASGVEVDAAASYVFELRDGKICRFSTFFGKDALQAVGLSE